MSKHIVKGFLLLENSKWHDEPEVTFWQCEMKSDDYTTYATIREHSFEVDVPDNFDATAQVISQLQEQKTELRLKLAQELAKLDERISRLSCLTNEASS